VLQASLLPPDGPERVLDAVPQAVQPPLESQEIWPQPEALRLAQELELVQRPPVELLVLLQALGVQESLLLPLAQVLPVELELPPAAVVLLSLRLLFQPCLFLPGLPRLLRPQPCLENVCELFQPPKDRLSWSASFFH
jgi:hypothetical protein